MVRRSIVLAALVALTVSWSGGPLAAATCTGGWSVVRTANRANVNNALSDLAVVNAHDVWAVGQSYNITAGQTLVEHWNGSTWSVVAAPHPGRYSDLRGVSAAGGAVWAVGNYDNNGLQSTLTERWTGSSWVRVASPNVG